MQFGLDQATMTTMRSMDLLADYESVIAFSSDPNDRVSLANSALRSWPHSCVVHDPDGRLADATSEYRRRKLGQRVMVLDPATEHGERSFYNPLSQVRYGTPHQTNDAQHLATLIIDVDGYGLADYWAKTAQTFLSGLILCVKSQESPATGLNATFADMHAFVDVGENAPMLSARLVDMLDQGNAVAHDDVPLIKDVAQQFLAMDGSQCMAVAGVVRRALAPLAKATQGTGWGVGELVNGDAPMSVYLVTNSTLRFRHLARLAFAQLSNRLVSDTHDPQNNPDRVSRHRLMFMFNDFAGLGRMPDVENAMPYMTGRGLVSYIFADNARQLTSVYGRGETVSSNSRMRICRIPTDEETLYCVAENTDADRLEELLANTGDNANRTMLFAKEVRDPTRAEPVL